MDSRKKTVKNKVILILPLIVIFIAFILFFSFLQRKKIKPADNSTSSPIISQSNLQPTKPPKKVKLYLTSSKNSYQRGENVDLEIWLDTKEQAVSSLQFNMKLPDDITFQEESLDPAVDNILVDPTSGFDTQQTINILKPNNHLIVGFITPAGKPVTGKHKIATINLKIKNNTQAEKIIFTPAEKSTAYDPNTQNILGAKEAYTIIISTFGKSAY